MKSNKFYIILAFFILLLSSNFCSPVCASPSSNWRLNEIDVLENGFFKKSDGDPFIVFPELTQPTCGPYGVQLTLTFDPVPHKPILLEIFWTTDYLGFGEENKVFFVVHPQKSEGKVNVIVPLDHTAGFRQLRLDFPSYINTTFKVDNYAVVPLAPLPEGFTLADSYYNLSVEESLKPDIIVPYLLKAVSHGPKRMTGDPVFLIFWIGLIIVMLFFIRQTAKKVYNRA